LSPDQEILARVNEYLDGGYTLGSYGVENMRGLVNIDDPAWDSQRYRQEVETYRGNLSTSEDTFRERQEGSFPEATVTEAILAVVVGRRQQWERERRGRLWEGMRAAERQAPSGDMRGAALLADIRRRGRS